MGVTNYGLFLQWKVHNSNNYFACAYRNPKFSFMKFSTGCYPLVQYLINHNVSGDQSPITVNRTNMTLYGVQPGETYYVEITPYYDIRGLPIAESSVLYTKGFS